MDDRERDDREDTIRNQREADPAEQGHQGDRDQHQPPTAERDDGDELVGSQR